MSFFVDKFVKNVYNIVKRIRRCGTWSAGAVGDAGLKNQ